MKALLFPKAYLSASSTRTSVALLALRLLVGVAFVLHGSGKIASPFGWMGPDAPVPGIFQALAALSEFGGGIALILGLLTPLASLGLISTMTVAALTHVSRGDSFVGGYELALVYLVIAVLLLLVGPGRFSADMAIFGKKDVETGSTPAAKERRASIA